MIFIKRYDYHVHNRISFDAAPEATLEAVCAAALQKGVAELALTNHYELDLVVSGELPPTDFASEEAELMEARERYAGQLTVLRGIELGQPNSYPEQAKTLLAARPYDVVLGSVHNLPGGLDFYYLDCENLSDEQLRAYWEIYLRELYALASEAEVDVQTHICYPVRYIPVERRGRITGLPERGRVQYEPIFRKLIERGIALEINTSCMRTAKLPEPDPGLELLRFYRELGGELITVGSDAHCPTDLGANLKDACLLAEAAGFRFLTTFRRRKKNFVLLSEVLE